MSLPRVLPTPNDPSHVAGRVVNDLYTADTGKVLLRCHRGDFFTWDGTCWPEAETAEIRKSLYAYLKDAVYEQGDKVLPWMPNRHKVADLLDALKAETFLAGSTEPPTWMGEGGESTPASEIVSMKNGLLHLSTRRLLPHSPDFFTHHSLPFNFDPDAGVPRKWLHFLGELWPNDESSISTLQELFGYILGGGTDQQKLFLLVGPKRGGKGTIGRVLTGLLGEHNRRAPTLASLGQNFGLQPLIATPLALVSDARLSGRSDSSIVVERLLSVSGEDALTVDRKNRESWTGHLPTRFVLLTNELPRLTDASEALASRFVMLVLTKSFYGKENPKLTSELLTEAPSLFNWALDGLDRLAKRGHFEMPESSQEAMIQLEDLASPVAAFLRERCKIEPEGVVGVDELWHAWKEWCESQSRVPGNKNGLGRDLRAAAPLIHKERLRVEDGVRVHTYKGIRLLKTQEVNEDAPKTHDASEEDVGDDGSDIHTDVAMTTMTTPPKKPFCS